MKRHHVRLAAEAEQDLIDIWHYIAVNDSPRQADDVLERLEELCAGLAEFPARGHVPPELERIGVMNYREVRFKPYRVIYEIVGRDVFIHCILDGRRDMQSLLLRRLTR